MDFDPAELLAKPLMAYLATDSPNGPPSSPVWFLWEEDAVWLIGSEEDTFHKRLRADPQAWNNWFKTNVVDGLELMIRITPETTIVKDMSYFKTGSDFAE